MLLALAWRNIWRNKRRTVISVAALGLGVMAIVSIHSFRETANDAMVRSITRGLVGHLQVHGRGYQASPDMNTLVADAATIEATVLRALPQAAVEKRVLGAGLAGAGDTSSPAVIMGLDTASPATASLLTVEEGRGLGTAPNEAVLGTGLASELRLQPGAELVLVGQAADGSLANDRFTVVGLADAGSSEANASAVFLRLADAQSFFGLGAGVHQLVVRLPGDDPKLAEPVATLRAALDANALEVLPWNDILPELQSAVDAKRKNSRLVDAVVLLIVALGVLNTMTMSTFERTREFGVLISLGTRPRRILAMVVLEALLQGAIGFSLGLALAWSILHGVGDVNVAKLGGGGDVLGARLPDALRLSVHLPSLASAAVVTFFTMLAGGLVPAVRASRLEPVEATRYV